MSILLRKIRSRARTLSKLAALKSKSVLARGDLIQEYGWIRLAFTNDGDRQEVGYHLDCLQWHRDELAALRDFVRPGATVVDVGANLGFMAAIFAELVGSSGRILSFEPSARTFAKLRRTIEINGLSNVAAFNLGCADTESSSTLVRPDSFSGHASLVPGANAGVSSRIETVQLVRLDDFVLPRDARIDFLKIDTEGYEDCVLRGGIELLRRDRPTIYIELCRDYRASSEASISLLKDLGYRFLSEPDLDSAVNGMNFLCVCN